MSPRRKDSDHADLRRRHLRSVLVRPVDGASLAAFRVGFGLLMLWQALEFLLGGRLERYFVQPIFHFDFYGFEWVERLPEVWMRALFWLLAASAVGIAFGWHYRLCAALFTLTHTYHFLIEPAYYNNHDYLIALIGFLLTVVPAHATFSLDARRRRSGPDAPAWGLWLLRFQIAVPYVYGALAKIDVDWLLRAQPLKLWLAEPAAGEWRLDFFGEPWAAYVFTWGGFVLDLLAVPALLWPKTRRPAVAALIAFHLLNSQLFEIGVFPWLMICSIVLFLRPDWPRRARLLPRRAVAHGAPSPALTEVPSPAWRLGAAALCVFVALQLLLPLRHLLYPGDVDWTEEGHRFAWRMKLRDKRGDLQFVATDPRSRRALVLDGVESALTSRQRDMMRHDPEMIRQFSHFLAASLEEQGRGRFEIRVLSSISLNGLPPRPMIDPQTDLAAVTATLAPAEWILPFAPEP